MASTNDILIVGGGLIGLSIAIDLRLRGQSVTVLERDRSQAAGYAAAGMLAPQAEALPPGPLLDLSLWSRDLYPDWVSKLEDLSGRSVGYWPCGILKPLYHAPATTAPAAPDQPAQWCDRTDLHYRQPGLSDDVVGAWWFPEDGQVDNRALMVALVAAAEAIGVTVKSGVTVLGLQQRHGRIQAIQTSAGAWTADHYILATGAWSRELLPVPVVPLKGQMLALRPPSGGDRLPLHQVLYGEEVYVVPRQDGRIVVGATSEWAGFQAGNTIAGLQKLLNGTARLMPSLADWVVQESWWGFRPASPDEAPILGESHCPNLTVAVGHHRNGVLLAAATARLIGDWVTQQMIHPLLPHFHWQRFSSEAARPVANLASQTNETKDVNEAAAEPTPILSFVQNFVQKTTALTPSLETTVQTLDGSSTLSSSVAPVATADTPLVIAGRSFQSRLMTGTGKYRSMAEMQQAIAASGCEIVTVAVRRVQTNAPGHEGLAEAIDWQKIWMLPNTAGCKTAEEAIRVARLGREMAKLLGQEDNNFIKLEVIPDTKYLLPDPIGTLEAAEQLVKEGFAVLPYINADPLLAKRLEEVGCATVMPLGSPIGSGQGIRNAANIQIIIENAQIPVVVDAGIGTPSEAAQAMEMGADALLINTAIAQAENPALMGQAMGLAAVAGRLAYLAGRIPVKGYASASSPLTGTISS